MGRGTEHMTDDSEHGVEYVTTAEARAILGVTGRRMSEYLARGDLQAYRRGLNKRIKWLRKSDVEAFALKLREVRPIPARKPARKPNDQDDNDNHSAA